MPFVTSKKLTALSEMQVSGEQQSMRIGNWLSFARLTSCILPTGAPLVQPALLPVKLGQVGHCFVVTVAMEPNTTFHSSGLEVLNLLVKVTQIHLPP